MKIQYKNIVLTAALLIMINSFSALAVKADGMPVSEQAAETAESSVSSNDIPAPASDIDIDEEPCAPVPDRAPAFSAHVEYTPQGYVVKGTFTEFTPDTNLVQALYSLDGENWKIYEHNWDLEFLGSEEEGALSHLQNQTCLRANREPFKSYLAMELDRFYLKLRITTESGASCDSLTAVIDRGEPGPLPDNCTLTARFAASVHVREGRPPSYKQYGRYQLTVREDASPEEIASFLPDTLPLEVSLLDEKNEAIAVAVADCPVTWKPLSFSSLTAGESIIISDAAEEVILPKDTLLYTPMGTFYLDEPLGIHGFSTDEVRLVLNVIGKESAPKGALNMNNDGLNMVFHQKPTGASAIRCHFLREGDQEWTEISAPALLEAVDAQPSTPNSAYALILDNASEPLCSYLAAQAAGTTPVPFHIGITIEGGSCDGRQLILPWPDTYECPLALPKLTGSGGNEGNVGADNKNDSTAEGQRPNLPQNQEESADTGNDPAGDTSNDNNNSTITADLKNNSASQTAPALDDGSVFSVPRESFSAIDANNSSLIKTEVPGDLSVEAAVFGRPEPSLPETQVSQETEKHSHSPSAPVAALACICIAGAACKLSAASMPAGIAGKIRAILHNLFSG